MFEGESETPVIDFEAGSTQEFPNIAPSNKGKMKERAVVSVFYTAVSQPQQYLKILHVSLDHLKIK